ncbi:NfeD family protein [Candidatus Nitrospira allomarina]|uniref:NfeD family protein n=1 Tax=Candidatus Nitrospira allomarina TaxID=3020900 RepID=A0AA96GE60_9BACT|nr:NfeD family protein [Candidatus Nitrospira allomarina]WNM60006.1 NfeD family protein [Candidatus Nitrospira allomarina]
MLAQIRFHHVLSTLVIYVSVFMVFGVSLAVTPKPIVFVAPIEGVIDLGLAPFVQRVLDEATAAGAEAVILEINTFGGRVDAAVLIRDALLNSKVLTVAFINKRAISAGALISLASEKIAMADGGTIGAATPVQIGLPGSPAQPVEEKTVSYMRKEFRATAEQRNRPPLIAEAMVDADVEVPDLIEKNKLLTLTTKEALQANIADFQANSLEAVLESVNLADADIRYASETWAESLVRFLTHPVVSSLLMTVGILGIMLEMRMPGFGVPGGLGLISLALFFWGHGIVQLAGLEEFLLVGLGLILVGLEIFVIPGFGIAGILGIMALMGGLGLSLIGTGATWDFMLSALGQVAFSILVAILATLLLLRYFPRLPFGRRLILETNLQAQEGYESSPAEDHRWLGKQGVAVSDLRPSGIARFDRERVDVVSDGTFIDAGQPLEVVRIDGNRVVVRLAQPQSEKDTV